MLRHFINLFGLLVFGALLAVLVMYLATDFFGSPFLQTRVSPSDWQLWADSFISWARVAIITSWLAGCVWYALAQWVFRVEQPERADKRITWVLIAAVVFVVCVVGAYLTALTSQGGWEWVASFFLLVFALGYWCAPGLFSPSSHKYTPFLATTIRHW